MSRASGVDAVAAAAERFFPGGQVEPVAGRSWLVSVTTAESQFSVRQLDPTLPAVRVDLIHEFLAQNDLRHATPLMAQDRVGSLAFDARNWVEGAAQGISIVEAEWSSLRLPADLQLDQLGSIAAALGAFHRTGLNGSILARTPHLKLKDSLTAARRALDLDERRLAGEIRKESRARRWLSATRPLLTNAEQALEQANFLRDESSVVAHLDLSGSHIVTAGDGTSAFLDCATIGAAPAAVDIAQLIARGGGWSDERVERVLQRYTDELAISPLQRRILPWLTALDAIPACGRLLVRAHDERHPLSDSDRRIVLAAADRQLELLASLASAFVPSPPRPYRRIGRRPSRENG
jgi:hypothetical protein